MTRVLARKEAVTGKGGHVTVDVEAEVMRPRARGRGIPQKLDEAGRWGPGCAGDMQVCGTSWREEEGLGPPGVTLP